MMVRSNKIVSLLIPLCLIALASCSYKNWLTEAEQIPVEKKTPPENNTPTPTPAPTPKTVKITAITVNSVEGNQAYVMYQIGNAAAVSDIIRIPMGYKSPKIYGISITKKGTFYVAGSYSVNDASSKMLPVYFTKVTGGSYVLNELTLPDTVEIQAPGSGTETCTVMNGTASSIKVGEDDVIHIAGSIVVATPAPAARVVPIYWEIKEGIMSYYIPPYRP